MVRVRSVLAATCLALLIVVAGQAPAAGQSSPSPGPESAPEIHVPEPVPGEPVCTITDRRLHALSGLVALDDGRYVVINSGRPAFDAQPIFFINDDCQVVDQIRYPEPGQRDPEDLAYDRERQILWVGDTGDKGATGTGVGEPRPTVALWRVDLSGGDRTPVIHRFTYPDGPRDAEGLLLDGDGTPIIVTREVGVAELFRPAAAMVPNNPPDQAVPLERIGEFSPPDTGTEHQLGRVARQVVTGAANHPSGDRVVLRTYTDAFEFDVVDGDVAAAITSTTPRVTPLPDEPLGEAIAYSPDGQFFVTVSEIAQETGDDPALLRYVPTEPAPEPPPETAPPAEAAGGARSLLDRLGPRGILNIIGAVGVLGMLMLGAGVVGIMRARREAGDGDPDDDGDAFGYDEDYGAAAPGVAPIAARARVEAPPAPPGDGGGYGGQPVSGHGPAAPGGTVYAAGGAATVGAADDPYHQHPPPPQPYQEPYQEPYHEPYDQDYPHGYAAEGGYEQPGPPPAYPDGTVYPDGGGGGSYAGGTYAAGTYAGGGYAAGAPQDAEDVPDYYSDDPDYSYEFRDRGEWG
jgi:hypothetical protein